MITLKQFSELPRYKLVQQDAEDGWGRRVRVGEVVPAEPGDPGEFFRIEDVRALVSLPGHPN